MSTTIANGLVVGAIYGLFALGLNLVFKKSRVLNFTHGEVGMFGAFVFYQLYVRSHVPYLAAAAVGVTVSTFLGAGTYLLLKRRANDALSMLIGTLGVAGVLVFVARRIWGSNQLYVPPPLRGSHLSILGLNFVGARLLVLIAAIAVSSLFLAFFRYSRFSLLFRASASDPYAASLIGVNVVRLDIATWALAGALAGITAILIAPLVGFDVLFMTLLSVRGFAAALIAGLGNVPASLAAGLALGIAESELTRATNQPGVPEAAIAVLIILILLRPQSQIRATA